MLAVLDLRGRHEFANSPPDVRRPQPRRMRWSRLQRHCGTGRVRDQVILGCADHEIKLDCLIEKGTSASREEVMAFVESKESGKHSLQQLTGGSVAAAPVSSFRKQHRGMFTQQTPPTPLLTPTCTHCGQVGHGSSRDERSDNCAEYSQICTKCGKRGHYAAVCRQQSTSGTRHGQRRAHMSPKRENATAAVFQSLCSVANAQPIDDNEIICNLRDFELEHCIYDPTHDTWVKKYSAPQRTLGLNTQLITRVTFARSASKRH